MTDIFSLKKHGTTLSREILAGVTGFLVTAYILNINTTIMAHTGMPRGGAYLATLLTTVIGTLLMAIYANMPFIFAPSMGLNAFFSYTICAFLGFAWQEALAITALAGVLLLAFTYSPLRKLMPDILPNSIKIAMCVGMGLFLAHTGLQYSGLASPTGLMSVSTALRFPLEDMSFQADLATQAVSITGICIAVVLLALERKTGEYYAALPAGILAALFIGIPLNVTTFGEAQIYSYDAWAELKQVVFAFAGSPGLLSVLSSPVKFLVALLLATLLALTNTLDIAGRGYGVARMPKREIIKAEDYAAFYAQKNSRLDRIYKVNAWGNMFAPVLGCSPASIALESVACVNYGGRTGLTALVAALLFLLCLPFHWFFMTLPVAAIASALIMVGSFLVMRVTEIEWDKFHHAFPAFIIMILMPFFASTIDGLGYALILFILVRFFLGKRKGTHPMVYVFALVYVLARVVEVLL